MDENALKSLKKKNQPTFITLKLKIHCIVQLKQKKFLKKNLFFPRSGSGTNSSESNRIRIHNTGIISGIHLYELHQMNTILL